MSHLEAFVAAHPERFRADCVIVADMGNLVVDDPVLSVGLRGHVEVRTLKDPVHSGLFGGAAPDALIALIKVLSAITDDDGACVVPGISSFEWEGAEYSEEMLRANAGVLEGVGSGGSIPLLDELRKASPNADFVLVGAEHVELSRIHGPNESVNPSEIEQMALAQALLLTALAE